jgi:hypothetical protein
VLLYVILAYRSSRTSTTVPDNSTTDSSGPQRTRPGGSVGPGLSTTHRTARRAQRESATRTVMTEPSTPSPTDWPNSPSASRRQLRCRPLISCSTRSQSSSPECRVVSCTSSSSIRHHHHQFILTVDQCCSRANGIMISSSQDCRSKCH